MSNLEIIEEKKGLSIDIIIEKFVPLIGALLLTIGIGYLIYTSVWAFIDIPIRLAIGFISSFLIIYSGTKFSDKLKYFSDVIIGSGVLLLYGTLIYGSRSEFGQITFIPEIWSLIVSFSFTAIVSFFAVQRSSKVILILALLGAYLTPFVIGQKGNWASNMSFNSYLIYFTSINVLLFQFARNFSIKNIIPVNIAGLFFGTSSLYTLSYKGNIIDVPGFFNSNDFSAIIFLILVIFSIGSIIITSYEFDKKDEGYISMGYIISFAWLILNLNLLNTEGFLAFSIYIIFAICAFIGWHYLKSKSNGILSHISLYSVGITSLIMSFLVLIPEMNIYYSLIITYISLIFAGLYMVDNTKIERLYAYFGFSFIGASLSLTLSDSYKAIPEDLYIILVLIPATLRYFVTKKSTNEDIKNTSVFYSTFSIIPIMVIIFTHLISYIYKGIELINLQFVIFYLIPLFVIYHIYSSKKITNNIKTIVLRFSIIWFTVGYLKTFATLIYNIFPAPDNTFFFSLDFFLNNWNFIYGIFAVLISYLRLRVSYKLKKEENSYHPTYMVVIIFYTTLFAVGNYIIFAIINSLGIKAEYGGIRAIVLTIFWIMLSITMMTAGIKEGMEHKIKKFLGLFLLFITLGKIILYDMETMPMNNKIIVLIIAGGLLLLFSYFYHKNKSITLPEKKNIKEENIKEKVINKTIEKINVSDIGSIKYILNNGKVFNIKTTNLFKITYLIINKYQKQSFEANELSEIYDDIINNYSSDLSKADYTKVLSIMKDFVKVGGKVEITKK